MASRSGSTRTCMCSPTNHPGSFRCSRHKKPPQVVARTTSPQPHHHWESSSSSMAAKANSLKTILLQMLKPSNHDVHKRKIFKPKPTRFCLMNDNTGAVVAVN